MKSTKLLFVFFTSESLLLHDNSSALAYLFAVSVLYVDLFVKISSINIYLGFLSQELDLFNH